MHSLHVTVIEKSEIGSHVSRRDDGFALVIVLWLLAFLSVVTLALTNTVRLDIQAKANLHRQAEAEVLADGLVLMVSAKLMEQLAGDARLSLPLNGRAIRCKLGSDTVEVSAVDVAGLVDLNAASQELLFRLLVGVGVPRPQATSLSAAIVDFRDDDDVPTPFGAEIREYRAAGLPHGPKNAQFESGEELDQVLGMTPAILARIRELVTVHSRSPTLDVRFSPAALVLALSAPVIGNYIPASLLVRDRRLLAVEFGSVGGTASRTRVVTVGVETASAGRARRRAVVEWSDGADLGFVIHDWMPANETTSMIQFTEVPSATCEKLLAIEGR